MGQIGRSLRANKAEQDGEDVKKQVDSDDKNQRPIYQLVNVKDGGGKLVEIIKSRAKTGSCSTNKSLDLSQSLHDDDETDRQIRLLVEPLLYAKGKGKLVPLSLLWRWRLGREKVQHEEDLDCEISNEEASKCPANYRWVCWKLEERGFVGETALHICFLLSTPSHMILARKLLALFPMLVNDIYTCDDYFGESSLHMAIVNENVKIAKLLLGHGANVHERCLGSFFLPADQKDKANWLIRRLLLERKQSGEEQQHQLDIDLKSNQFSGAKTNYDGHIYWGEYPLSFAASLGLVDCYKLLLAHGANPNLQDSNGNATLHMTVIANRIDMFDLCYSTGGDLDLINRQNLSPLTLAAKLRRVEVSLMQPEEEGSLFIVGFVKFPLNGVDSINTSDGSSDDHSVLSIVVFEGSNEHLEMLNGLLSQLLAVKWDAFIKDKFYFWFNLFLAFISLASVAYITRFDDSDLQGLPVYTRSPNSTSPNNKQHVQLGQPSLRAISELGMVACALSYLLITCRRLGRNRGLKYLVKSLAQAPELFMFSITCLLILACVPLRLIQWAWCEDFVASLIMFTIPLTFLFFCRASKKIGPFIVMIYRILAKDLVCFIVFLVIFIVGFSESFFVIFRSHKSRKLSSCGLRNSSSSFPDPLSTKDNNYFANFLDGIISMHMMALMEFTTVFDEFDSTDYPVLARLLFGVYMVLVSILLFNMIIAMLGKTYQDIESRPNENLRQWARALLMVERMCTSKERLRMLDRYSHDEIAQQQAMAAGSADLTPSLHLMDNRAWADSSTGTCRRYYNTTWALTPADMSCIKKLRQLDADNKAARRRLKEQQQSPSGLEPIIAPSSMRFNQVKRG